VAVARPRRIVVVGGGASGGLVALHLLRRAPSPVEVVVLEPREALGGGIAYSTPTPWHRINVPARTMGALPDEPGEFAAWAGIDGNAFAPRGAWGAYLAHRIAEAAAGSRAHLRHERTPAERLVDRGPGAPPAVRLRDGSILEGDAIVIATGNALPRVPAWLSALGMHQRVVLDAWAANALDAVEDGERVAVVGTGHTAADVIGTVLRTRPASSVVAISRHGELPRMHEDPPRVRPSTPVFSVETFLAFRDPLDQGRAAIAAHPEGWRQGLDSLRSLHQQLWLAMDEGLRTAFLARRREWEVHRSRLPAEVGRDLERWVSGGRLELRAFEAVSVRERAGGLELVSTHGDVVAAERLVLAAGPDEDPDATPLLRAGIEDGLLRPGPFRLGIDADAATLRVRDAAGGSGRPVFALGPVLRGVLWETIAVPEIRVHAAKLAERLLP